MAMLFSANGLVGAAAQTADAEFGFWQNKPDHVQHEENGVTNNKTVFSVLNQKGKRDWYWISTCLASGNGGRALCVHDFDLCKGGNRPFILLELDAQKNLFFTDKYKRKVEFSTQAVAEFKTLHGVSAAYQHLENKGLVKKSSGKNHRPGNRLIGSNGNSGNESGESTARSTHSSGDDHIDRETTEFSGEESIKLESAITKARSSLGTSDTVWHNGEEYSIQRHLNGLHFFKKSADNKWTRCEDPSKKRSLAEFEGSEEIIIQPLVPPQDRQKEPFYNVPFYDRTIRMFPGLLSVYHAYKLVEPYRWYYELSSDGKRIQSFVYASPEERGYETKLSLNRSADCPKGWHLDQARQTVCLLEKKKEEENAKLEAQGRREGIALAIRLAEEEKRRRISERVSEVNQARREEDQERATRIKQAKESVNQEQCRRIEELKIDASGQGRVLRARIRRPWLEGAAPEDNRSDTGSDIKEFHGEAIMNIAGWSEITRVVKNDLYEPSAETDNDYVTASWLTKNKEKPLFASFCSAASEASEVEKHAKITLLNATNVLREGDCFLYFDHVTKEPCFRRAIKIPAVIPGRCKIVIEDVNKEEIPAFYERLDQGAKERYDQWQLKSRADSVIQKGWRSFSKDRWLKRLRNAAVAAQPENAAAMENALPEKLPSRYYGLTAWLLGNDNQSMFEKIMRSDYLAANKKVYFFKDGESLRDGDVFAHNDPGSLVIKFYKRVSNSEDLSVDDNLFWSIRKKDGVLFLEESLVGHVHGQRVAGFRLDRSVIDMHAKHLEEKEKREKESEDEFRKFQQEQLQNKEEQLKQRLLLREFKKMEEKWNKPGLRRDTGVERGGQAPRLAHPDLGP
jgi:hypothetical protein